jgi:ATPase subunit of ABC transporter with duplicated ATPase domains
MGVCDVIALNKVAMAFGNKLLFTDVDLILNSGNRYALVGANGSGKSTFFKLITGEEVLSAGDITIPKEASIGWLKQDQYLYEDTAIRDVVLQGKPLLWAAEREREALMASDTWDDAAGFRFAELEEIILHHDGYQAQGEIATILEGLGIPASYHEKPLSALSGGYKLRVLLAQVLFQRPAILMLDEPTNHLDILSIQWLEKFLKTSFTGLVVFISHDIEFINNIADAILDIDYGEIRKYSGKYHKFLEEKQLIDEQKRVEKKSAEDKIAHLRQFVDRFGAKASKAAQARSRVKMIEKIEIPDVVNSSRQAPHFNFVAKRSSGKQVCQVRDIGKSYQDKLLFKNLNFEIQRGEKLAIMGVNGKGKSTLLKILMDKVAPDAGEVVWGTEVRVSYFSQDHHDLLNESTTALKWLNDCSPGSTEQQVRQVLGQMLFKKDDVDKNILSLSGGEAARLLLAKVILEAPNVLVLDEPTNHLDVETIEELSNALAAYQGTLIVVSHNRYFIEKFANRIVYFSKERGVQLVKGTYAEFVAKGYLEEK